MVISMFRLFISGGVASVMMGMTGATIGAVIWDTAAVRVSVVRCNRAD